MNFLNVGRAKLGVGMPILRSSSGSRTVIHSSVMVASVVARCCCCRGRRRRRFLWEEEAYESFSCSFGGDGAGDAVAHGRGWKKQLPLVGANVVRVAVLLPDMVLLLDL